MHRAVDCETWRDRWFSKLTRDQRYVFLYLITNESTKAAGNSEITPRFMACETGFEPDEIVEIVKSLHPHVLYYPDLDLIWVRNFFRHQNNGGNFIKSAIDAARKLPNFVRREIYNQYPELKTADWDTDIAKSCQEEINDNPSNGTNIPCDVNINAKYAAPLSKDGDINSLDGIGMTNDGIDKASDGKVNPSLSGQDRTGQDRTGQSAVQFLAREALGDSSDTEEEKTWGKPNCYEDIEAYFKALALHELNWKYFAVRTPAEMAKRFWQHFEDRDWLVGVDKLPMSNWKSLCTRWMQHDVKPPPTNPASTNIGTADDLLAFVTGTGK